MLDTAEGYDWNEHKHRYAVWAAATASSASPICRFSVLHAMLGIELFGPRWQKGIAELKNSRSQDHFDQKHKDWCQRLSKCFESVNDERIKPKVTRKFSFGVAAKFVNVYLKTVVDEGQSKYIHPPIDRILLKTLTSSKCSNSNPFVKARNDVRQHFKDKGEKNDGYSWSLFDFDAYKIWIDAITDCLSDEIWRIEEFWNPSGAI